MYVPLWCKSNYSFLEGASHPEELVQQAWAYGLPALALTDRDGVYGVVRAHLEARRRGVHLLVGAQITVEAAAPLVLLAQDRRGYANLCRLISAGRLRSPKGSSRVGLREVCEAAPGLIALWTAGPPVAPGPADPDRQLGELREAFADCLYAALARHRVAAELALEEELRERAARQRIPLLAATEVLYHERGRRRLQDVLTCIRHNCTLQEAGTRLRPNAEHALKTAEELAALYADQPALAERTLEVARRCAFNLDELQYRYPSERLPGGRSSAGWLRELAFRGARRRYRGQLPQEVRRQLERELEVIEELDYCGYFLTMWEIVDFCRRRGILCQGRGSAANSAVCYCLGITAVDPVRMELLFERFISRERAEPPDIDLDIEHRRREEVIQHVYQKYGRARAAMVANFVRYRARSAVRDVGKALGIPATTLNRLAGLLPYHLEGAWREEGAAPGGASLQPPEGGPLAEAGLDRGNPTHRLLSELLGEIQDFPRHLSIHPGGFLLGAEPVASFVPVENATMPGRTVIQWDKYDVEDMNLFKVDLLGLGALTHLDYCFRLLRRHRGLSLSMATIPDHDPELFDMICRAETVGVFQIESRAQMAMLPRLKPRCFYDLVIEVSIVRPGPITGGMVHPYLRRRSGLEPVVYPHPALEPVLRKTLGVPLFQEQVMRLAVVAADYTPGEADQLRRDMAAWRRSGRIEKHGRTLVERMVRKGIAPEFARRVFDQIRGFGEYGFPESHAASFALIAYCTAWLKCHYPVEFTCALLNAWPMGFYAPATIIEDAKRRGVAFLPPDVLASGWECTLEPAREAPPGHAVRLGLRFVKGLGEGDWRRIQAVRRRGVRSLQAFLRGAGLDEGALAALAESGALECFGCDRRQALWAVSGAARRRHKGGAAPRLRLADPSPAPAFHPLAAYELIGWDYEATGLSSRGHPLEPLRSELARAGLPEARELAGREDGQRVSYAGLVICRQRPENAGGVVFMTLEDESGFVNVVIWAKVFQEFRTLVLTASFLGVTGTLQARDGVLHVMAESFWTPRLPSAPAKVGSRDFH